MCIIMAKPKGVALPSKETFRICYTNNPDGCGFMYVKDGQVIIRKGFMGYKNMYKEIKGLGDDKAVVVHFRIGTSGKNDQKTCHPYPISDDIKDLQRCYLKTDVGMVHNGIVPGYIDKNFPELNDTQVFIRDFLSKMKIINDKFYVYPEIQDLLEDITGSKLAFLDNEENIHYVGHFTEEDGVKYSNYNYKHTYSYVRSLSYPYYDNYWDNPSYYNGNDDYYKSKDTKLLDYDDMTDLGKEVSIDDYDKDDIDYDCYVEIKSGYYIGTQDDFFQIIENDKYGIDSLGNYFELTDQGFPGRVVLRNATLFDENCEEVMI